MMAALVKEPPVISPWPPLAPDKKPITVGPRDSLSTVASNNNMPLKDLLLYNFKIDMDTQRLWAYYVNWYLREKVGCTRLTPGGNYRFSGGETIYVRKFRPPPRYRMHLEGEVVSWFRKEIIPLRTVGKGAFYHNIWRIIDLAWNSEDYEVSPNGLCGEAAFFVQQKFLEETTGAPDTEAQPPIGGKTLGQVLWNGWDTDTPTSTPNHTANIICPDVGLKIFTKNSRNTETIDKTPRPGNTRHSYAMLMHSTVLDLYRKEVSTLDKWWRECSWFGYGRLTIDTTRYRKHLEK